MKDCALRVPLKASAVSIYHMGQEQSMPPSHSSSRTVSILEPLSVSVIESPLTCSQRREQIMHSEEQMIVDQDLIRAIMALTEQDPVSAPMNPHAMGSEQTGVPEAMRAEAERDFVEWRRHRRLIKRLSRHDSSTSTASSSFFENGVPHSAPARSVIPHHHVIRRDSY